MIRGLSGRLLALDETVDVEHVGHHGVHSALTWYEQIRARNVFADHLVELLAGREWARRCGVTKLELRTWDSRIHTVEQAFEGLDVIGLPMARRRT